MSWLKLIPYILVGAGFLWAIVASWLARRYRQSNIQMKNQLDRLNSNLYQLKTGMAVQSSAQQSLNTTVKRVKEAKTDEEAKAIVSSIADSAINGLRDYYADISDLPQ